MSDLDDFLDKPVSRLQVARSAVVAQRLQQHAVVRIRPLGAREQVADDALEQRHVLATNRRHAESPHRTTHTHTK